MAAKRKPTKRKPTRRKPATRRPGLNPGRLLELGLGFMGPRVFLSAIELGLFTLLAREALNEPALRQKLGLHERAARDFLDTLVALGLLTRKRGCYANAPDVDLFLDRNKPSYVGGLLEMAAARLYGFWGTLTDGLRTGQPQNEARHGGDLFGQLYADPERLRGFLSAMTGVSMGAALAIAKKFPWRKYRSFCDVGGAQGCVGVQLALAHKHLSGGEFDLPVVQLIYEDYVRSFGLEQRLGFKAGDFFRDPLPSADVLIMGHVLHDWSLQEKHLLLQKAYAALPRHGVLIVYEAMIDDDRSQNLAGLLMSLNMLIETTGGFDYTIADCRSWMKATGFRRTQAVPLAGHDTMVIGYK